MVANLAKKPVDPFADFIPTQANYTLKEAMAHLRLGETAVRDLIRRGLLQKSRAVRKIIITGKSVETFMERTK